RMLYCLLDGHARTSTELSVVGEVSPSTASVHLGRLKDEQLVMMVSQGKHRYYRLNGEQVADALEALSVIANPRPQPFVPPAPNRLRVARTCYDHMAGTIAVALHDRFTALRWLAASPAAVDAYELSAAGLKAFTTLGVDLETMRSLRRRFAFACLDWSERRPHLGGALGAAVLSIALKRNWVVQDLDSRALAVTAAGHREFKSRFGV
ncbi:MAG TPA: helix-turn-helix domain-containing protein, partial [Vicinamibacterales bacterium]